MTSLQFRHAELVSASIFSHRATACGARWTLKRVQGDEGGSVVMKICALCLLLIGSLGLSGQALACIVRESPQSYQLRLQRARVNATVIVIGELRPDRKISPLNAHVVARQTLRGEARRRYETMGFSDHCIYRAEHIRLAKFYLYEPSRSHPGNFMIMAIEAAN